MRRKINNGHPFFYVKWPYIHLEAHQVQKVKQESGRADLGQIGEFFLLESGAFGPKCPKLGSLQNYGKNEWWVEVFDFQNGKTVVKQKKRRQNNSYDR